MRSSNGRERPWGQIQRKIVLSRKKKTAEFETSEIEDWVDRGVGGWGSNLVSANL